MYTSHIIRTPHTIKPTSHAGTKEQFERALVDRVLSGGEIGVWRTRTTKDNFLTELTVVGFYATATVNSWVEGETLIACWEHQTTVWVGPCCDCGCGEGCAQCQCCCEPCPNGACCKCCCGC